MANNLGEVAAHEAGHAIVSMAVGVPIVEFVSTVGSAPGSSLINPFETFAVVHDPDAIRQLEPRLTYLCAVGGFSGETTHQGYVEPKGALDDLAKLRAVALTDIEIQLLTGLAMEIIAENRRLWEQIYDTILFNIERSQTVTIPGRAFNNRFAQIGKRFTDTAKLDAILKFD